MPPQDDRMPWTGLWPGVAECSEFGWYEAYSPDEPALNRLRREARWDREAKQFVRPKMGRSQFWGLIEEASGGDCRSLVAKLSKLSAEEIFGFQENLDDLMGRSYRDDLWDVAHILFGGWCSPDSFDYLRGWIITQGEATFDAVLNAQASLLDVAEPFARCEEILYASARAYEKKTGFSPLDFCLG